jgi:hypothetical protein
MASFVFLGYFHKINGEKNPAGGLRKASIEPRSST